MKVDKLKYARKDIASSKLIRWKLVHVIKVYVKLEKEA